MKTRHVRPNGGAHHHKIKDQSEKSWVYLEAVLALQDKKDDLVQTDLHPLRMAAKGEIDAFIASCDAEIEATQKKVESIQEKAKEVIQNIRAAIDEHPFQVADRIRASIEK